MTQHLLNEADKRLIDEFIEIVGNSRINKPKKIHNDKVAPTTAFYVGRTLDRRPIPKRQGNVPGTAWVGLFKFVETSGDWQIEPVLYPNGEQVKVKVHNIDKVPLEWDFYDLQRNKYGRWVVTCCQ